MLFDLSPFRVPLPEKVVVFASSANRVPEILGFARVGIPIGVSVPELNEEAIQALIGIEQPVMIDSGASSEVAFTNAGPCVVRAISHQEWLCWLAIYLRLAHKLGRKALLVAPDRVGDQAVTLQRLTRYRLQLAEISSTGAGLLIPLQIGDLTSQRSPGQGTFAVADPTTTREWYHHVYRVTAWNEPRETVTGGDAPSNGSGAIADPRPSLGSAFSKYAVTPWGSNAGTVIGGDDQGAYAVADPRAAAGFHGKAKYRVTAIEEPSNTVIAQAPR